MPRPKTSFDGPVTQVKWPVPTAVLRVIKDRTTRSGLSVTQQAARDLMAAYGLLDPKMVHEVLPCMGTQIPQQPPFVPPPMPPSSLASYVNASSNPLPVLAEQPPASPQPAAQQDWGDAYKRRLGQQTAAASTPPDDTVPSEIADEPISPELQALLDQPKPEPPPTPLDPYAGLTYDQLPADAPAEVKARVMQAQLAADPTNPFSGDGTLYQAQAKRNVRDWHDRHGKMMPEQTSFGDATISDDHIRPDWQRPPVGTTVHPVR